MLSSFFVDDFIGGEGSVTKAFELFKKFGIRFLEGYFLFSVPIPRHKSRLM